MRRFYLVRHVDPSGVSGTGIVAHGVEFCDGSVALRWICAKPSTSVWDSIEDMISVHGHAGSTIIRWLDMANNLEPEYAMADRL
jgi:hypothetical protein